MRRLGLKAACEDRALLHALLRCFLVAELVVVRTSEIGYKLRLGTILCVYAALLGNTFSAVPTAAARPSAELGNSQANVWQRRLTE